MLDDKEDDIALLRERLSGLPGVVYELSAEADAAQALAVVRALNPAVVFLNDQLGTTTGLELMRALRREGLLHPVIALSVRDDGYFAAEITRAGANAYLVKDDLATPRLAETLGRVIAEAERVAPQRAERAQTLARINSLTAREAQVLDEIVNGLTNKQIADKMERSVETIKVHRAHIMTKLMADSTADLVRRVTQARIGG